MKSTLLRYCVLVSSTQHLTNHNSIFLAAISCSTSVYAMSFTITTSLQTCAHRLTRRVGLFKSGTVPSLTLPKVAQQPRAFPFGQQLSAIQQQQSLRLARPVCSIICRSSNTPDQDTTRSSSNAGSSSSSGLAINAGLLALWAALMGYVFFLAPNQTPSIDSFVVQKLVGLKADDPFQVNEVFTSVWNFMGLYPLLYAAILIPGARTDKLPAWPFVCASVFLGAYALIPYMCLWSPKNTPEQLPPPESQLEGWNKFYMRAAETPWLPLGLVAGSTYWLFHAFTAGADQWAGFLQFFDESRLCHATSIDFMLCTLLMPFWMSNDAQGRNWDKRDTLVPLLSLLPLVGPATYLLLRPKTYSKSS